ncbi:S8 family serine peptidase [Aquimarina sp. I32.4]|uniref:S8 family serine peptidase n=1 Tax=Aquimarina sp. I32.4 TaxID=2053903 RepID=UPI001304A0D6|nr:S8 family serine peptidase [Aquimarina sp. I32.4]
MNHLKFKKRSLIFGSLLTVALVVTTSCNKDEDESVEDFQQIDHEQNLIPKEYIVVFKDATIKSKAVAQESISILEKYGITEAQISREYTTIFKGILISGVSQETINTLKKDPIVKSVVQNSKFELEATPIVGHSQKMINDSIAPNGQIIPWGASRVGYGDGTGKKIWILDTGIADNREEFNIDRINSRNFSPDLGPDAWQANGSNHGTQVASIAAAKNNATGILGIAAGATVVSIRTVGGGQDLAGLAGALDYVGGRIQPGEVWNMSAGPTASRQALLNSVFRDQVALFENALRALSNIAPGFVAAGNTGVDLDATPYSESHFSGPNDQLYIVGAIDNNNNVWNSSMYGRVIDYWSPGVNLPSLRADGTVSHDSGTSLASPTVAAMYLISNGNLIIDSETATDRNGHIRPIPRVETITPL